MGPCVWLLSPSFASVCPPPFEQKPTLHPFLQPNRTRSRGWAASRSSFHPRGAASTFSHREQRCSDRSGPTSPPPISGPWAGLPGGPPAPVASLSLLTKRQPGFQVARGPPVELAGE